MAPLTPPGGTPLANVEHETDTRQRLLNAAGEVFAEVGFHTATTRDIARRASANIAAINYYFRDKQGLYTEAVRLIYRDEDTKYPATPGVTDDAPPDCRLRAFIHGFMHKLFDAERPAWHGRLLSRELFEPTEALDAIVAERIRPRYQLLRGIISDLLGAARTDALVRLCINSVIGQCLHYHHARHMLARLQPECPYGPHNAAELAEHVARFSLGAIAALARGAEGRTA